MTVSKVLILGVGSMGTRHLDNLLTLRPGTHIVGADPHRKFNMHDGDSMFADWREAIRQHPDADAAIIASPTLFHLEQMHALHSANIPFYVKKPLCTVEQLPWNGIDAKAAVGYQYRFHHVYRGAAPYIKARKHVRFYASENLVSRYGPDCLSIIAAHPIDTALWLLGPAVKVNMQTDGLSVHGMIRHEGGLSEHKYRIDGGPRVSMVSTLSLDGTAHDGWSLDANNDMYRDALSAWLYWIDGGWQDTRTATLADGIASLEVMAAVVHV